MRAVIQRVARASVTVGSDEVGSIGRGFLILLGVHTDDTVSSAEALAGKAVKLRIFEDEDGKMNLPLDRVGGEVLVISQFTLYGDTNGGNRPSFIAAARPETAIPLYERFIASLRERGLKVETGVFGAHMSVSLVNDGPVSIIMDA